MFSIQHLPAASVHCGSLQQILWEPDFKCGAKPTEMRVFWTSTLGESYMTKVADYEFAVQSESSIDVVYSVDTERGTCSCHSGATGNMCKHLKSVLIHNHIQSDLLYRGSPEERRWYAIITAGLEKAPSLSFFANANSPIDNASNDFTCSTTSLCENTDEASVSGLAREHETENEDRNDDNTQSEVPNYYQENKQQLENFCSTLNVKMEQMLHSREAMNALQKANFTLSAMHSGPQILSALHAFGKTSAVYKNFGRKIRCQPTALSRRRAHQPRGCAPVAEGRPPSCNKAGRKRKRNLASNIALNQQNAKTHGHNH